jgi:hypothetical protein
LGEEEKRGGQLRKILGEREGVVVGVGRKGG